MKKFSLIAAALMFVASTAFAQVPTTFEGAKTAQAEAEKKLTDAQEAQTKAQEAFSTADKKATDAESKAKSKVAADVTAAKKAREAANAAKKTLDEANAAVTAAQTAVDTAKAQVVALTPKPSTKIQITGTWKCNGSSQERLARENIKQQAESKKKKKSEGNINVTVEKICNTEAGALSHDFLKGIDEEEKFTIDPKNPELVTLAKGFPQDWSCSKPTLKAINTFYVQLETQTGQETENCIRTNKYAQAQGHDVNNLKLSDEWMAKVSSDGKTILPTIVEPAATDSTGTENYDGDDLKEIDANTTYRECTYSCQFIEWSNPIYLQ